MMIRFLIALCLFVAPATAQVITSPARLPDGGDGVVELVNAGGTLTPPQKKGTRITLCPDLSKWSYVKEGTACPAPVIPAVDGKNKNGVYSLATYKGPVRVTGAYRAIETYGSTKADGVVIDGLVADNLQRGGIRLRGQLSNITIRNSSFSFRAAPQEAPNLPACMEVGDKGGSKVTGLLIQNVTCDGFQMTLPANRYWNGDGPTLEGNVSGLMLDNVTSRNNTDGCFDIKPVARATRIEAEGCTRNIRIWKGIDAEQVTTITPNKRGGTNSTAHIWVKGSNAQPPVIHIGKLIVTSTNAAPIFLVEDGLALITVDACDIRVPAGTSLLRGKATLKAGPGCVVK